MPYQPLPKAVLTRLEAYITAHLRTPIRLVDLAQVACMSISTLGHRFPVSTGLSPYAYVLRCRTAQAAVLLTTTTLPLATIAEQVGVCDQSSLGALFTRHYGVSPGEYRRLAQQAHTQEAQHGALESV